MAQSFTRKVFNGASDRIPVAFPYLDKSHVKVYLDGVLQASNTYSWPTDGEIQLNVTPASGVVGYAPRTTPEEPITVFSPGNLDVTDLNVASLQPLYLAQEARDLGLDTQLRGWLTANSGEGGTITLGSEGSLLGFDGDGNLIPVVDAGDIGSAQGYAEDALGYRDEAAGYAAEGFIYKNLAGDSAAAAAISETNAANSAVAAGAGVGAAIRDAAAKSAMLDADLFGLWDTVGLALKKITLAQVVARIFQTTRTIANGVFAAASFALRNAAGFDQKFDTTALTADRQATWPDRAVNLGNVPVALPYASAQQTLTLGAETTLAHGMGVLPSLVSVDLVCVTADLGYAAGETVQMGAFGYTNSGWFGGFQIRKDTSSVYVGVPANAIVVRSKTLNNGQTANITLGSWRYVARAWA